MFTTVLAMLAVCAAVDADLAPLADAKRVDDVSITIPAGEWRWAEGVVSVPEEQRFFVRGAGVHHVNWEPLQLSPEAPSGYWVGTKLQAPRAGNINALGALIPESLELRPSPDAPPLTLGKDYLVSAPHALVGIGPDSSVTTEDVVFASYDHHVERVDSIVQMPSGALAYHEGRSAVAVASPPEIAPDARRIINIFRPYGAMRLAPEHVYVIEWTSGDVPTHTTPGRIPKTLEKLQRGEEVTIVAWGDSVTVGGDIPDPADTYVRRFEAHLKERFPEADITLHNVSVGGTKSVQWLADGDFPGLAKRDPEAVDFDRVLAAKPDLVTIEFVNDAALDPAVLPKAYDTIIEQLSAIGAEIIFITPHFTHPRIMQQEGQPRVVENRPYVAFLREFADAHGLALADASSRWEHCDKQGIPYLTLLANRYNHPTAEGGDFFVQELMKCFLEM